MISSYNPTLRKPSESSADWYINFHNVYYLSQVTNLAFQSYLDTEIDSVKHNIIDDFKDELLKKNIIRFNKYTNYYSIKKESEFNSIYVESTINDLVDEVFLKHHERKKIYLMAIMLKLEDDNEKELEIKINRLLNTTSSKNWYELLRGLLNAWEFLFLYGAVESTLKQILNIKGHAKEEKIISDIFIKFDNLGDETGISQDDYSNIWNLYTEFRNIYAHGHGMITPLAKTNLGGKLNDAKKSLRNINSNILTLSDTDNIFNKHLIEKNKFYFLKDKELNIFRNLAIILLETVDSFNT